MRIDYHKWRTFKECPKRFFLEYIEKKPALIPENDYFALYGNLVGKFFEIFCNIWRFKTPHLFPEVIRERLAKLYDDLINTSTVIWTGPKAPYTKEEIFEQSFKDVCAVMESHNQNYFLNSKSEITIEMTLKDCNVLNGRIDFLHYAPLSEDFILIDGKGSTKMGKNVSPEQLYFYALLCYFQYKKLPQEMGFFYYRFNTFEPIPINTDILNEFRARVSLDIKSMTGPHNFIATPSAKSCKYCPYLPGCLEGSTSKAKRAKKSKLDIVEGNEGITEFGF